MNSLPPLFLQRLKQIIPAESLDTVLQSFAGPKALSFRHNPLKGERATVIDFFRERQISLETVSWYGDAFFMPDGIELKENVLVKEGKIYIQQLSSMLAPLILDPRQGETILDMCAAPGSKASQISALMAGEGELVCLENIKARFYKLKSVLNLMGVRNAAVHLTDARRYRPWNKLFDKILLDAPCSSEGRFRASDKKTFAYWSLRKIKEMVRKQRGLLLNAARLLKPGGTLVYSTCTFAPEENEGVIDWVLKKSARSFDGKLETAAIKMDQIQTCPPVLQWLGRAYHDEARHCVRVLPSSAMEGFFIAKLRKGPAA